MSSQDTHASTKEATTGEESYDDRKERSDRTGQGKDPYYRFLIGLDPDTLPPVGWADELPRRFAAFLDGRDGWRDGSIETEIDDWGGGDS